jgi:hypothetical protein
MVRPHLGIAALFLLVAAAACSAEGETNGFGAGGTGPGAGGSGGAGTPASGATSGTGGVDISGAGGSGGGSGGGGNEDQIAEVFGQSASVLYRLDPETKMVTTVGPFSGCSSVIDIALDKDSNLYATTSSGLFRVDKATAVCTLVQEGGYPNSVSFVPAGTVDPSAEALVGYSGSTYVRIDTVTGAVTTIGEISGGYFSSGDIVSVKDGGTYLTVNGPGCNTDCLLEVNPATGDLVKNWGPLGYSSVFGIAFWEGSVYGFTNAGELFEITFEQSSVMTSSISVPAGLSFWGAGSTTSAPPVDVPD